MQEVNQDKKIDLRQYLSSAKSQPASSDAPAVTINPEHNPADQALTPLQRKLMEKDSSHGLIVSNDDLAKANNHEMRENYDTDEHRESLAEYMDEKNEYLEKRKYVVMTRPMSNPVDQARIIDEIDHMVTLTAEGPKFNLFDEAGNPIEYNYIRPRTENDPAFNSGVSDEEIVENAAEQDTDYADADDETSDEASQSDPKKNAIQIIIDKTGLGADVFLTQEERKKVTEARELRLIEVEEVDLSTITIKRPTSSFLGTVRASKVSAHAERMLFPASGYTAELDSLYYGEMGDIALNLNALTQDKYRKRLTTIFNKMHNISRGPFEDFDDFLKNTAYTDIQMATYGLMLATYPDVQTISLHCNKCNKNYNWDYSTRSILHLNRASEEFDVKMAELANAHPSTFESLAENAPVHKAKRIKLPFSGIIADLGIISAHEFITNYVPLMDDGIFKESFGEDENDTYKMTMALLLSVSAMYVPDDDGSYIEYRGYDDIIEVIMRVDPDEFRILYSYASKFVEQYTPHFHFTNMVCPHCGNKTDNMNAPIDELVFQMYQRLLSTTVDLKNAQLI